jgi:hypothetical protein
MQPNELKAVLTRTKEVAIQPVHVEVPVQNQQTRGWRGRLGEIYCPTGLVKATVIEDGYPWVEKRNISVCGDTTYAVNRRNGVLVEIDLKDIKDYGFKIERVNKVTQAGEPYPHSKVISRAGKKYIRLVTSRKAIFTSWGEYELEMAKREKERQAKRESRDALRNPQAILMGVTREELYKLYVNDYSKPGGSGVYLGADYQEPYIYDDDGNHLQEENGHYKKGEPVGRIDITVEQANKIISILTPAQKRKLKN